MQVRSVPPPEMVANLRADNIDGFLAPDPVNQRAVFDGAGFIHILSKEIWDGHPCCAFAASKEFVTQMPHTYGALLGQMKLVKPVAKKAAMLFGLTPAEEAMLNEVPYRGMGTPMPPTDPLIYRFYEMVMINGPAWKALIEEEFGDGIMSAIDFNFDFEREANPKGDRVKITMSGKFLPYKYYGNEQGIPDYGFKETV